MAWLTAKMLRDKKACSFHLQRFVDTFGSRVYVTVAKAEQHSNFPYAWAAGKFLRGKAKRYYNKIEDAALAEWIDKHHQVCRTYEWESRPHKTATGKARKKLNLARARAFAEAYRMNVTSAGNNAKK